MGEPWLIYFGSGFCFEIGLLLNIQEKKGLVLFFFFLLSSGAGTLPSLERHSMTEDRLQVEEPPLLHISASLGCGSLFSWGCGVGPTAGRGLCHRPSSACQPLRAGLPS